MGKSLGSKKWNLNMNSGRRKRENMCEWCWIARDLIGLFHDFYQCFLGCSRAWVGTNLVSSGFPLGNMWEKKTRGTLTERHAKPSNEMRQHTFFNTNKTWSSADSLYVSPQHVPFSTWFVKQPFSNFGQNVLPDFLNPASLGGNGSKLGYQMTHRNGHM